MFNIPTFRLLPLNSVNRHCQVLFLLTVFHHPSKIKTKKEASQRLPN